MAKLSQQKNNAQNGAGNSTTGNNTGVTKVKRTRRSVPRDSPPQRSSIYRGVTRHRWTGRYEAHLWDKNCWNESQNKKGRQVYLGAYDDEEAAAHAYDLAALKYWGEDTILNFPLSTYQKQLKEMEGQSREEYIGSLRRKSSGFSRGVSKYRGVARHHHNGRWEARIGRVFGNKYLYLGTYATQEEAATAYDMAAIEYRGLNAVTNFDLSRYIKWLKPSPDDKQSSNTHYPDTNSISNTPPNPNPEVKLSNFFHKQSTNSPDNKTTSVTSEHQYQALLTQHRQPTTATSALGLLLQSSKFKEMMEMTSAADYPLSSLESDECSQQSRQCSFPDDIRTYFDSTSYGEGEDIIFGELNTLVPTMFQSDFDA